MTALPQKTAAREPLAPIVIDLSDAQSYEQMVVLGRIISQHIAAKPLEGTAKLARDGETGERRLWVRYQQTMLENHPDMEVDPTNPPLPVRQSDGTVFRHINQMRLKPDVDPDRVRFKLGYTQAALQSYAVFKRLRDEGAIPQGVRFQFALPSPLATGSLASVASSCARLRQLLQDVLLDAGAQDAA